RLGPAAQRTGRRGRRCVRIRLSRRGRRGEARAALLPERRERRDLRPARRHRGRSARRPDRAHRGSAERLRRGPRRGSRALLSEASMKPMTHTVMTLGLLPLVAAQPARADEGDRPIGVRGDGRVDPEEAEVATGDSAFFARETSNNLLDINLTNYGFFGNNFQSSKASFVYPRGATVQGQAHAFEHMVRGGIWFGAQARDANGAFTGVVTGTTDGNQGSSGTNATEWTPIG